MIRAMFRNAWLNLKRDYVALALTFVLPIAFFSIFASVFGNMAGAGGGGGMSNVKIAVVDLDGSDVSRRVIEALDDDPSLDVHIGPAGDPDARYDRAQAEDLVRGGQVYAALIFPKGFGDSFGVFGGGGDGHAVELLADVVADPVSYRMVSGLLQGIAMSTAPDLLARRGLEQFDKYVGMTDGQRAEIDHWLGRLEDAEPGSEAEAVAQDAFGGLVQVQVTDVGADPGAAADDARGRMVAFYAAAIGVMFLLFSMAGAMGTLLQEERTGTLERLLNTDLGMGRLLLSYWLFAAIVGFAQLTVMFVWGWLVFGLDLWTLNHVTGFIVMTAVAAAAAAGFGMMLGTACRSEAQLRGISTIVILVMSAVGGSMFPRFLMPQTMQKVGLATFNGWAIDGYRKVFHLDESVFALWPQVLVLAGMTVVFLAVARILARRWEVV